MCNILLLLERLYEYEHVMHVSIIIFCQCGHFQKLIIIKMIHIQCMLQNTTETFEICLPALKQSGSATVDKSLKHYQSQNLFVLYRWTNHKRLKRNKKVLKQYSSKCILIARRICI